MDELTEAKCKSGSYGPEDHERKICDEFKFLMHTKFEKRLEKLRSYFREDGEAFDEDVVNFAKVFINLVFSGNFGMSSLRGDNIYFEFSNDVFLIGIDLIKSDKLKIEKGVDLVGAVLAKEQKIVVQCDYCKRVTYLPIEHQGKVKEIAQLSGMVPLTKDQFSSQLDKWICKDHIVKVE
jgi:hypothetical protein